MSAPPIVETRTTCPYCGVGCGLRARVSGTRLAEVTGDPDHPVNRGRTCRKPLELPYAVHAADRATVPLRRRDRRRDGRLEPCTWDQALGEAAARLRAIIERHGPDAVAFYVSGQLLSEDYYAAVKLVKGFLGTHNLDSNSRLCMSSAVSGYAGAYGFDGPPPAYRDLELADCTLVLGANPAACHPILWQRVAARRAEGAHVICVDPRRTPTAAASDAHLQLAPGTDLPLLNAMLTAIVQEDLLDAEFVRRSTTGLESAVRAAAQWTPECAADVCRIHAESIRGAARRFATAPRGMVLWSMGANQSAVGTLKNRAIHNLCLATGQIGRPGTGPLSLTGQPNAMGGREAGGLAHLLPGYRRVDDAEHRMEMEALWGCPEISPRPGLPAVEMFEALRDGRLKAVWVMATNPVVSMPDAGRVREALAAAELVVVQDAHHPTETGALADYLLPAAAWPEKTGTMTNSERRVSLVRAALPPAGDARPDWRILSGLAAELGLGEHFAWRDEAEVYDELVRCTAGRPCDVSGLSHARLALSGPVQWPCPRSDPAHPESEPHPGTERLYERGRFPTADGRARFAAIQTGAPGATEGPAGSGPAEPVSPDHPIVLTTGRLAEQWHTMSRTGKSPSLRAAAGDPSLELSAADAGRARVLHGEWARVVSARGEAVLRVRVSDAVPDGVAFAPMHFGALHVPAGAGTVNALTNPAVDRVSFQPELKATAVRVERLRARPPRPSAAGRRRLVVVGDGMAGLAVVEEVLRRRPADKWAITLLGEEAGLPYNRILLSKLLAMSCGAAELGLRPLAWFGAHGIARPGPAASLELPARRVLDVAGEAHEFDSLVLATGSRPFVPPIPGAGGPHVHTFRTLADAEAISAAARPGQPAVVVGGGLLGLEAAAGMRARGLRVTVVELAASLMPQQLGELPAGMLRRSLERLGLAFRLGRSVATIEPERAILDDGEQLPAELVVVAAGVRAETTLARAAGLEVARGVLVDDTMRTSAPGVWAVGECAEHRGTVHGLLAPAREQARVAAADVAGDPAAFLGYVPATTLKVAGVDLFCGGLPRAEPDDDELVVRDTRAGVHRQLVLRGERLAGATLVGDTSLARRLSELLRSAEPVPAGLLGDFYGGASESECEAGPPDPASVICSCNTVTAGEIMRAIDGRGLGTLAEIATATRATTGCGGCAGEVQRLLGGALAIRSSERNRDETVAKSLVGTIAS